MPLDAWHEPTLLLFRRSRQKNFINVAEGAADENVRSVAELFLNQHPVEGRKPPAAELFRNVHGIEAKGTGVVGNPIRVLDLELSGLLDDIFQGAQLTVYKPPNCRYQQGLLVGKLKFHHQYPFAPPPSMLMPPP